MIGGIQYMQRIPISTSGYDRLKTELERLKNVESPHIIEEIAIARGHGDLSENAEYDAAKERQGMIEARIKELDSKMTLFDIIDMSKVKGDKVTFGATVILENIDTGDIKKYKILGPDEADITKGEISILSPLSRALVGKQKGDDVIVKAPNGDIEYELKEVSFE